MRLNEIYNSYKDRVQFYAVYIIEAHPDEVEAFRGGREQVFGFLMGQVMRATDGKANPDTVRDLLRSRLEQ